jgi:hypothetical protein
MKPFSPNLTPEPWQPIETAPKTSKAILVYVPSNRCTFAVTWRKSDGKNPPCWEIFGGGSRAFLRSPEGPSHWMPLPSPPEQKP